ncbi:GNAT family N-acetyltransferase [Gemmobacter sp.]|uniref:GNAT family N-acetyltransferase n=1 Tax=Gemmobacter sp. TaxID=1898957 RepID=UPI002AFFD0A7|nr:GNAT family N-acetyltransferase [Gemmobacter sp.]
MIAPRLETARLILRAHRVQDYPDMAAMWGDANVTRFILGAPATPETTWSRLLRYAGHWQLLGHGYWALECRATGAFLGEAGLADYHRSFDPPETIGPEAGWVLATAAHGRGLATEAMAAVMAWADAHLAAPACTAIFDPDHKVSQGVARKVGFAGGRLTRYNGHPTLMMTRPKG